MKIMITGGAGFIGSHLLEHFQDDEVIVIDDLSSGNRKNITRADVQLVKKSITDGAMLKKHMKGVDYVFHLAALISVQESFADPMEIEKINTQGTLNVIKAARENKVKKIIFISSAGIYGDDPVLPKHESMKPLPNSPYAISKISGEYYLNIYKNEFNVQSSILRCFNVFGPRQNIHVPYASVIPLFIDRALNNRDLIIYGDGEQSRDFIYVKDVVQAGVIALEKGDSIYNTASGISTTVNQLAEMIIKLCGSRSKIVYEKERPGEIKRSVADIDHIRSIGFKPSFSLEEGLSLTIDYYKKI